MGLLGLLQSYHINRFHRLEIMSKFMHGAHTPTRANGHQYTLHQWSLKLGFYSSRKNQAKYILTQDFRIKSSDWFLAELFVKVIYYFGPIHFIQSPPLLPHTHTYGEMYKPRRQVRGVKVSSKMGRWSKSTNICLRSLYAPPMSTTAQNSTEQKISVNDFNFFQVAHKKISQQI